MQDNILPWIDFDPSSSQCDWIGRNIKTTCNHRPRLDCVFLPLATSRITPSRLQLGLQTLLPPSYTVLLQENPNPIHHSRPSYLHLHRLRQPPFHQSKEWSQRGVNWKLQDRPSQVVCGGVHKAPCGSPSIEQRKWTHTAVRSIPQEQVSLHQKHQYHQGTQKGSGYWQSTSWFQAWRC